MFSLSLFSFFFFLVSQIMWTYDHQIRLSNIRSYLMHNVLPFKHALWENSRKLFCLMYSIYSSYEILTEQLLKQYVKCSLVLCSPNYLKGFISLFIFKMGKKIFFVMNSAFFLQSFGSKCNCNFNMDMQQVKSRRFCQSSMWCTCIKRTRNWCAWLFACVCYA